MRQRKSLVWVQTTERRHSWTSNFKTENESDSVSSQNTQNYLELTIMNVCKTKICEIR